MNVSKTTLALALVTAVGPAGKAVAGENPFGMQVLSQGYMVADAGSEAAKAAEGKCGEGKCGAGKATASAAEGGRGAGSETAKTAEGKCGEGKCGAGRQGAMNGGGR